MIAAATMKPLAWEQYSTLAHYDIMFSGNFDSTQHASHLLFYEEIRFFDANIFRHYYFHVYNNTNKNTQANMNFVQDLRARVSVQKI